MAATFNWVIRELERQVSDGLVTTVHWSCLATDGAYVQDSFGAASFTRGDSFIPFESLTKEQVIEWVKAQVDSEKIEANLQSVIDRQKTPVTVSGMPW